MVPRRSDAKRNMGLVRQVAARLRAGETPDAGPSVLRLAGVHLLNRAVYNKRRRAVRALAAEIRAGGKPAVPAELAEAVRKHLAYRAWYNEQRRLEREQRRESRGR